MHLTCWQVQFPCSFITQITYNLGKCQVSTLLKGGHSFQANLWSLRRKNLWLLLAFSHWFSSKTNFFRVVISMKFTLLLIFYLPSHEFNWSDCWSWNSLANISFKKLSRKKHRWCNCGLHVYFGIFQFFLKKNLHVD